MSKKYRYECRRCKACGRWFKDPNLATIAGQAHYDKFEYGHDFIEIVDSNGKNHGSAL